MEIFEPPKANVNSALNLKSRPILTLLRCITLNTIVPILFYFIVINLVAIYNVINETDLFSNSKFFEILAIMIATLLGVMGIRTAQVIFKNASSHVRVVTIAYGLIFISLSIALAIHFYKPSNSLGVAYNLLMLLSHPMGMLLGFNRVLPNKLINATPGGARH